MKLETTDPKRPIKQKTSDTNRQGFPYSYKIFHALGWAVFAATILLFFSSGYQGEKPVLAAFGQVVIANVLVGWQWPKGTVGKREFLYNVIFFALQIAITVFILYPKRQTDDATDILMLLTWIPLVGLFTYVNMRLVEQISNRSRV